jgi:hypothetical protein
MFDVRSGEDVHSTLLPIDDDSSGAGTWWAVAALLGVLGVGVWLWLR